MEGYASCKKIVAVFHKFDQDLHCTWSLSTFKIVLRCWRGKTKNMSQYLLKAGEISVVITGNVDIRLSYDNTCMKVSSIIYMIRQRNIFLSKDLIAIIFLTLNTDAGRISCFNLKCVFKAFETFNRLYCYTFTDLPVSSPATPRKIPKYRTLAWWWCAVIMRPTIVMTACIAIIGARIRYLSPTQANAKPHTTANTIGGAERSWATPALNPIPWENACQYESNL